MPPEILIIRLSADSTDSLENQINDFQIENNCELISFSPIELDTGLYFVCAFKVYNELEN